MLKTSLPYVHEYMDRTGKRRRYLRRRGKKIALKAEPGTPEYLEEYQRALKAASDTASAPADGTWAALITLYLQSAKYRQLKPRTKTENLREIERIRLRWGKFPVHRLEARHLLKWQDELAETPGKANNMLSAVRMLLNFGTARGFKHQNPAAAVEELKGGSWRSWTDDEIRAFEDRWPLGTRERLIFDLALYTGQRRGDLVTMTRHHITDNVMGVVQEKTGERIAVPVHENLKASIAAFPSKGLALIQRLDGQPLKVRELHDVIASAIDDAKLPDDCVLHGLRYSAARCLADAGASPHEIMAITGHRTLGMVEKYTKQANKTRLAGSALTKLTLWRSRTRTEQESG